MKMSDETRFSVRVDDTQCFGCAATESVLAAMQRQGVGGVVLGCRAGGCGVCRVRVTAGAYRIGPVSRAHLSEEDQENGFALACRLFPQADLCITPAPKTKAVRGQ